MCAILAVLGVVFYIISRPKPVTPTEPRPYVWDFDMDSLQHIEIAMPKLDQSMSWIKHDDKYFYFDMPNGSKVDMQRWGGGIPLLLSGPGAARRIAENIPDSYLNQYGFTDPNLKITLLINDNSVYNVLVGDATPAGSAYYIKLAEIADVYTVDSSWYDEITRLVTDPPYPPAKFAAENLKVYPDPPQAFQTITLSVEEVNSGAVTGTHDVILKVNAVIVATKTITLMGGERQTVTFTIKVEKAGIYSINIDGATTKLVVQ